MSKEVTILEKCLGLNTRDHPSELGNKYLAKAVNVDISDQGSITRRGGYSLVSSLAAAHSLEVHADRYAIYADGVSLYSYDTVTEATKTLVPGGMTEGAPICYTPVGDRLVFTNGVERGMISPENVLENYFEFIPDLLCETKEIVAFPMVDLMHFYNGSMYGAVKGDNFLYCSEPYKPAHYDQVGGYIMLPAAVQWVGSVGTGVLVGTDSGVFAFIGSGLADFQEKQILFAPSMACSKQLSFKMESQVEGVLTLTHKGVFFITDQMGVIDMTAKISLNWGALSGGVFVGVDNSYIFTGS